jgi:F1F0 ATPase subunit 2
MFFPPALLIPFVLGGLIGWVYFTGLWETVRRLPDANSPYGLMIFSFAGRSLFALGGFFILTDGQWERATAALLGFFIMRVILVRSRGRIPRSSPAGA